MIAGFNIDGFMQSTVGIFPRDEISEEGAAGTVDGETFRKWLREKVCPKLGDYRKRERNSIVIMDNTCKSYLKRFSKDFALPLLNCVFC